MSEWYKNWFASEDYLKVYRHRNEKDAVNLINLILSSTNLTHGSSVLDAACGAGRHSVALKKKGFNITAFDLSIALLKIGLLNSRKLNLNIDFFQCDIRNVPLKTKFDLIINLFTSFGYFDSDDENFKFIKDAQRLLLKGGYFVFDYLNKDELIKNLVPETKNILNGKNYFEKRYIKGGRVIKEIIINGNGENNNYIESVKLYSCDELISVFENSGFQIQNLYGDYKGNIFNKNNSGRLIIIARNNC
ncbi:MAG: class I SAM-dependent methyltransferase [Bacteroidetes bacterium]|nr:class I SAM-dependent methyltransferase [Bacteroidota bacterium]